REDKKKLRGLPKFELEDRQIAADLQLSADGTHVFILLTERPDAARRAEVPDYVTESGYVEPITGRTFVGDVQSRRRLAAMNLDTGRTQMADAAFAESREVRWSMPLIS